jgi:branched-chain amino acid transport system permease protein
MEISATYLPQLMLNGLIYALIAVGLALILGVIEVNNSLMANC